MAYVALAVSVLLNAALAAVAYVFYQRLCLRISALSSLSAYPVPENRYAPPLVDSVEKDLPVTDVVGAWALEMAAAGIRVTSEEMDLQRRMRLEGGY